MDQLLIIFAGLPGVGKSTAANILANSLNNFRVISQNQIQRSVGFTQMPQEQDAVLREIDRLCGKFLNDGLGVIVDSVNRFVFRRSQLYGIASAFGCPAIILEIMCSETEAKKRLKQRPTKIGGLISDPGDPQVYDRIFNEWEEISKDFRVPGQGHVSHVIYDTERHQFKEEVIVPETQWATTRLGEILLAEAGPYVPYIFETYKGYNLIIHAARYLALKQSAGAIDLINNSLDDIVELYGTNVVRIAASPFDLRNEIDRLNSSPPVLQDTVNDVKTSFPQQKIDNALTAKNLQRFEAHVAEAFNAGIIHAPVHLYSGNENEMIRVFQDISENDWVMCSWRSHYQCLLKGVPEDDVLNEILRGRSISLCFPKYRIFSSAIAGGVLPIATGVALSIKRKQGHNKVHCFLGDMTAESGIAYECIKYSQNHDLPIRFIIEDNGLSVCTDTKQTWKINSSSYSRSVSSKVVYYQYENSYPHAGGGKRVQF